MAQMPHLVLRHPLIATSHWRVFTPTPNRRNTLCSYHIYIYILVGRTIKINTADPTRALRATNSPPNLNIYTIACTYSSSTIKNKKKGHIKVYQLHVASSFFFGQSSNLIKYANVNQFAPLRRQ